MNGLIWTTKREKFEKMLSTTIYISETLKDKNNIKKLYDWVVKGSVYDEASEETLGIVLGVDTLRDCLEEELENIKGIIVTGKQIGRAHV